ncbi:pyruvate dehydrogenase E1 component subunit alpha [Desulfosarcina ovata subsp. sediminis]|uniref:Pyruvate dehydrogenase E1 component subunit alpha n=1 Tax=Desulfosarcina ovata subsp. sediminis TaxID=885957 RepID=A0A5K7ZJD2_9BACT|nr:thiamine pyrophosphate-dependent dehydrogenase E1 component subunit alpha [Desulfosarcina ovata]BBO81106.1 pyruvate dehydrogenase E1 component subunit alpha [Desulfosarcina ovata subsp. sediminis]
MANLTNTDKIELYRKLVHTRKHDELNVRMASEGKLRTFYHSAQGHEAIGVGACSVLHKDDYLYPHLRGHGIPYVVGKGMDPKPSVSEHLGKATGWGGGITGVHIADKENGIFAQGGTIGSAFVLSAGFALAAKKNGTGQVCMCFVGDGSVQRGQAHEAMNLASCWKLPVVWVVENNLMAWFTPCCDSFALKNIADMAKSYNMPGKVIDGMDVFAVREAAEEAVDLARKGDGPSMLECKTYRFRPHSEGRPDVCHYLPRSEEEIAEWKKRDPLVLCQKKLVKEKILTKNLIDEIELEADEKAKETEKFALESPYPDPSILDTLVYAP